MHIEARVHIYLLFLQAYGEGADLTLKATIYHLVTVKQDHWLAFKTFTLHARNAEYNPKVGSTATFPRCKHMCYFIYLSILPLSSLRICEMHLFCSPGKMVVTDVPGYQVGGRLMSGIAQVCARCTDAWR